MCVLIRGNRRPLLFNGLAGLHAGRFGSLWNSLANGRFVLHGCRRRDGLLRCRFLVASRIPFGHPRHWRRFHPFLRLLIRLGERRSGWRCRSRADRRLRRLGWNRLSCLAQAVLVDFGAKDDGEGGSREPAAPGQASRPPQPLQPGRAATHGACLALLEGLQQPAAHGRISQQLFQRLLVRQRVEQLLVAEGGGKQSLPLLRRERIGGESAEQFLQIRFSHIKSTRQS